MRGIQESQRIGEILDLLCIESAGHRNSKAKLPTYFKICFAVVVIGVGASILIAALAKLGWMPRAEALGWSYGLVGICELSALTMTVSTAWSFPKEMKKPLARDRSSAIQLDYLKILQLRSFPPQDLEYLSERLLLEAEQLRGRGGLVVGALDKVGIIPFIVGSAYTLWKFSHEASLSPSFIATGLAVLTFVYAMEIVQIVKSHRADQLAQLLKSATSKTIDLKLSQISNATALPRQTMAADRLIV